MKIRVLFIARYRTESMNRKVEYLAKTNGIDLRHICPAAWHDEYGALDQHKLRTEYTSTLVPMLGTPSDPHRALYRTLGFGMVSFRPHIIHAEEEPDSLAALQIALARKVFARQAKLILHTWQNVARPLHRPVQSVLNVTLSASNHIFCANTEAVSVLKRNGYTGSVSVLPAVGVDTEVFQPCSARTERPFTVGYVGRLAVEKGIDNLIAAVNTLKTNNEHPICLQLVGNGPAREFLYQQVLRSALMESVLFIPSMSPTDIARRMCCFDVLVLPSRTTPVWKEQFGRVLTEAMACGVPVVGSNSGAIPEVIGDAGLIFPEGDAQALAGCLQQLMDAPSLRQQLAQNGPYRINHYYSQEIIAEKTARLYQKLLEKTL